MRPLLRPLSSVTRRGLLGGLLALALPGGCGPALDEEPGAADDAAAFQAASLAVPGRAKVAGAAGGLNLRAGPGTSYAVLALMPAGALVDVVAGPQGSFYQVRHGGQLGWAHGGYLQAVTGGGGVWQPRPGTSWQWQLSGALDTSFNVVMYDVDLFTTTPSQLDALRARGRKVICYFSAGSYEPGRPDSAQFPAAAKGRVLDGWPDERWLDTRAARVREIMKARLDLARQKGCDGVEPDNVDAFDNASGFPLSAASQLDYNRFLAREAHARGLSVGLKNDLGQVAALVGDFDWALNEECFKYDECDELSPFLRAGKAVFQVEYGGASVAGRICPEANRRGFDSLVKDLDLDASRIACR